MICTIKQQAFKNYQLGNMKVAGAAVAYSSLKTLPGFVGSTARADMNLGKKRVAGPRKAPSTAKPGFVGSTARVNTDLGEMRAAGQPKVLSTVRKSKRMTYFVERKLKERTD